MAGPAPPPEAAEPMLARRHLVCTGCGEPPEPLHPSDAVGSLRLLQRRSEVLLRHHQRSGGEPYGAPMPGSALESAGRISEVLAAADRHLRRLLEEPDLTLGSQQAPPFTMTAPTAADAAAPAAALAGLPDTAARLIRTIVGATTEDWYRGRRGEGVSAAAVVWQALHDAVHHLEDVELAWVRVSGPTARSGIEGPGDPQDGAQDLGETAVVAMSLVSLYGAAG